MMWLVKFADNWADEIDVEGFRVLPSSDFMNWARLIEEVSTEIDKGRELVWYIGTNESITYSSGRELKECFECEVIEDGQATFLKDSLIKFTDAYGLFPNDEVLCDFLG